MSGNPIGHLDATDFEAIGRELDVIGAAVMRSRGARDRQYILRMIRLQRTLALAARVVMLGSIAFHPTSQHAFATWPVFAAVLGLGTVLLAVAKIIENMEIGHNVLHAQWDWMNDANVHSATWEWDHACPADQWKHSHNVVHHTWTNVLGMDRDVGYGMLRVTAQQRWHPFYLLQAASSMVMALAFEWFIAIHDVELNRLIAGKKSRSEARPLLDRIRWKVSRQILKDYVLWPALAGPFCLWILAANIVANVLRNLWTFVIIFCGHFPDGVHHFSKSDVENETRGQWYVRQLLGSCNIEGGTLFHILSGNLSHQIEHHLFPDMPSNRYAEVAPHVRALAARYGLPYTTGRLGQQFGSTIATLLRLSLPVGARMDGFTATTGATGSPTLSARA